MIGGIDHVVIAVDDPDAVAARLEEALSLRASGGGRHERLGTYNRLVWLGDTYLELIGVFDRPLAETNWLGVPVLAALERGGGLATWAVAVDDLEAHLRWTAPDVGLVAPIAGERRRPDGRVVRWRLSHPVSLSPMTPFLIEHDAASAEWTADERRERAAETHPIGAAVRLVSLEIAVPVPASAAARLRRLLGTNAEPDGRRAVRLAIADQLVRFAQTGDPSRSAFVDLATDLAMRRRSAHVGDCEIRLSGHPSAPRLV
jgi:hypothetical protein